MTKRCDNGHPDVQLFSSYGNSGHKLHVRIIGLLTRTFPYGLELEPAYGADAKDEAEKMAVQVQKYLDAFVESKKGHR